MKLITTVLTTAALMLSMTAHAVEFSADYDKSMKPDRLENIPSSKFNWIVTNGKNILVSENGRVAIMGEFKLVDMWTKEEITSVNELDSLKRVRIDKLNLNMDELSSFKVGNGPQITNVFVDPLCPYCKKLIEKLDPNSAENTTRIIIYPVLGKQSIEISKKLNCLVKTDQKAAMHALMSQDWSNLPAEACDTTPLLKAVATGRMFGIQGVPFVIAPNGETQSGLPKDFPGFIAANHLK
jgi:thiol:disulfide interchange protein DsbC